jgi:phage shock protein PspC (stress-responsive transcriptional regulator)
LLSRLLAGVCGSFASYFNLDATLIRVLFVVLAVL